MRLLLTILLASATAGAVLAQDGLSGTVVLAGHPLAGATVQIGKTRQLTDSNGKFSLHAATGTIRLRISAAGALPFDSSFQFSQQELLFALQPRMVTGEEVVISGTMKAVSKTASPIQVEVYTPAYFKKNPTPNLFEGLQLVNGVQPQLNCNVCNTGDIHINGMEGPYTMILIDGMPIVSSLATVYGLSGIPNSMIKRMEIVKGPASTLYGSEAVGGLINIITKTPGSSENFKADISATGVGEYTADAGWNFRIKKTAGLLGISYFNYNQLRDINRDNFTDIALQNRISIFNKWIIPFNEKISTSLAARYIYENRWGGEMQWHKQFRGSDSIYGESIRTNRTELISSTAFGKQLHWDLSWNLHQQDSYYGTVAYMASQQVLFNQVRYNTSIGHHQILAGIPFRYTYYDDNTPGTADANGNNRPEHNFLPGIFVQDEWQAAKQWLILTGLRYDYHNQHGSIVTPRLAVKYNPAADHTFRLSIGNGYRVVNLFTEDHAALTGAREVVIANQLQPEKSWNVNLGYALFKKLKHGFLNADASIFYTRFSNKIVADYFTDPGKIIYDNLAGYAISKGITVNADAVFSNGLKLNAGITWMDVYQVNRLDNIKTRSTQLFAPRFSGSFTAAYTLPKKITIDLTGKINGPMLLPVVPGDFRKDRSPWYPLLNLQLSRTMNQWELYAGVKNLFNFIPKFPILHPDDPFNKAGGKYFDDAGNPRASTNPHGFTFDPSYNYAPVQGAKWFAGLRYQL